MSYLPGGESGPASFVPFGQSDCLIFFQMSKKQVDSLQEISDSNIQDILLSKPKNANKKAKKDTDMLATSSAQESGSDSLGEARLVKPTPADAHALVKVDAKGKLQFNTKAIAKENKELKDRVFALQAQLEEASKSPRIQPDPSPAKDPITEGLEGVLSKDQFDSLCKFLGNQVAAAVKSGHEIVSPVLPLLSDAPGPSKAVSSQAGIAGKSLARASPRDILGTSMGDGSEDDLGDLSLDDQEG